MIGKEQKNYFHNLVVDKTNSKDIWKVADIRRFGLQITVNEEDMTGLKVLREVESLLYQVSLGEAGFSIVKHCQS